MKSPRNKVDSSGCMSVNGLNKKGMMKQEKTEEYIKRKASIEEAMKPISRRLVFYVTLSDFRA